MFPLRRGHLNDVLLFRFSWSAWTATIAESILTPPYLHRYRDAVCQRLSLHLAKGFTDRARQMVVQKRSRWLVPFHTPPQTPHHLSTESYQLGLNVSHHVNHADFRSDGHNAPTIERIAIFSVVFYLRDRLGSPKVPVCSGSRFQYL